MSDNLLLTLLWLLPLLGAFVVLLIPSRAEQAIKGTSLAATLVTFALTLVALSIYVAPGSPAWAPLRERAENNTLKPPTASNESTANAEVKTEANDLVVRKAWIPYFNIQYFLGLDGISLSLVLLTGLVSVLACLASWTIDNQVKGYFALFLVLVASMMGVFLALDLFLFYVFFEVMLLPMYFLIAVWGGGNREYSAIKFLLYTLFGSVFILVAVLVLYFWTGDAVVPGFAAHSFDIVKLTWVATETGYYRRDDPASDLRAVLHRLLHQAAVVPVPHVVARRARRGADADQHDPGRHPAQDRRLWADPARLAAGASGRVCLRVAGCAAWASSASSTARWWRWRRPTSRSWSPTARSATWAT